MDISLKRQMLDSMENSISKRTTWRARRMETKSSRIILKRSVKEAKTFKMTKFCPKKIKPHTSLHLMGRSLTTTLEVGHKKTRCRLMRMRAASDFSLFF
jgi:hypothetical protein